MIYVVAQNMLVACIFLTIETCAFSVLYPGSMDDETPIRIQCSLNRLMIEVRDVFQLSKLSLYRKPFTVFTGEYTLIGEIQSQIKAIPNSEIRDTIYYEYRNPPPNRNWDVDFTGVDDNGTSKRTMAVNVVIGDPNSEDAGWYRCDVAFINNNMSLIEVTSKDQALTWDPFGHWERPMFTFDARNQGGILICNAWRTSFPEQDNDVTDISQIVIYKKKIVSGIVIWQTIYTLDSTADTFKPMTPFGVLRGSVTVGGAKGGVNNFRSVYVKVVVDKFTCQDNGTYRCQITYRLKNPPKLLRNAFHDFRLDDMPCK